MMKSLLLILISGLILTLSCNKIAGVDEFDQLRRHADDSSLTEEQKQQMQHNASVLAYKELIEDDSTFIDIDEDLIDFYYDVLVTVMTSDEGKGYPITQDIWAFYYVNLKGILVQPAEDTSFIETWEDSVIQTGIEEIDSLIFDRGFELNRISYRDSMPRYFSFTNNVPTNTPRVGEVLEETGYFEWAGSNSYIGDGSKLVAERMTDQRETVLKISYIYGGGDCPAGCTLHHYYVFHVYEDGTVQFINEFDGARPQGY